MNYKKLKIIKITARIMLLVVFTIQIFNPGIQIVYAQNKKPLNIESNKKDETKKSLAETSVPKKVKGKIKSFITPQKITVTLEESQGIKINDILYIVKNDKKIGEIKVLKLGLGWLVGWVTKVEKDNTINVGDELTSEVTMVMEEKKDELIKEDKTTNDEVTDKGIEDITVNEKNKDKEKKQKEKISKKIKKEKKKEKISKISKKKKLAIVNIENKTKIKDKNLPSLVLDSLTYHFVKNGKYEIIEREAINQVLGELIVEEGLKEVGLMSEEEAQKIGKLLGADIVVVGSISSIIITGKPEQYFVEINVRAIEVDTGKVNFVLKSRGTSGKIVVSDKETLIAKAIDNAVEILIKKLPVKIFKITMTGTAIINLGKNDGITGGDELPVLKENEEIGKLKIQIVKQNNAEGIFYPLLENKILKENDEVVNIKVLDAPFPKIKKKNKGLLYVGIGVTVGLIIVLLKKDEDKTSPAANVPPSPQELNFNK